MLPDSFYQSSLKQRVLKSNSAKTYTYLNFLLIFKILQNKYLGLSVNKIQHSQQLDLQKKIKVHAVVKFLKQ